MNWKIQWENMKKINEFLYYFVEQKIVMDIVGKRRNEKNWWRFELVFEGVRIVLQQKNQWKMQWHHRCHRMQYLLNVQLVIDHSRKWFLKKWKNEKFMFISSWKDPNCPFRTDSQLRLKSIPTLIEWGTVRNDWLYSNKLFIYFYLD